MKKIVFTSIVFVALIVASCKVTFNGTTRDQIEAKGLDIKRIQYYNSQKIVLKRVLTNKDANVTSGEVRLENGLSIEVIEIPKNTPGVIEKIIDDHTLAIRFDEGEDEVLIFEENKVYGSDYELKTKKFSGRDDDKYASFFDLYSGEVVYGGKKYYVNSTISKPKLKIKKKESNNVTVKKRKAKGVLVE